MDINFERKLLNYLYYDLNRLRYFVKDEIFEYDIQSSIHQYLKLSFNNKNVLIKRENKGKVDHVIQITDENNRNIYILIELKSFIKKHEKFTIKKIEGDIKKLYKKINENTEKTEGYLIIVIKESHLNNKDTNSSKFINVLKNNKRSYFFKINESLIRTRIIKSRKTMFLKKNKCNIHKDQLRLFLIQIK